jgi:hypothetical protein
VKKRRAPKKSRPPNRYARAVQWRSGFEKDIRHALERQTIAYKYEPTDFQLSVPGSPRQFCDNCGGTKVSRRTTYTPDFYLVFENVYVEAKGKLDARAKRALKAMKEQHPNVVVKVLLQKDNWTTRKHTERYSGWLTRHGYVWAVGNEIPKEWYGR